MSAIMEDEWDWKKRINIDNNVMGGKPVIKGTRVPLEVIIGALAGGDSIAAVSEGWNISEEDVRAALAYAAHLLRTERLLALPS
jgi:uncharacterized protein (DUF433 family)